MFRYVLLLTLFGFVSIEIYFFHLISNLIGIFISVIVTIASGLLGLALAKRQGLSAISGIRNISNFQNMYLTRVFNGFGIMIAALLLILPGFLTDFLGFLLFIGPLRRGVSELISQMIKRNIDHEYRDRKFPNNEANSGPIIDGEFNTISTSRDERTKTKTGSS